jgi:hypothetical protein
MRSKVICVVDTVSLNNDQNFILPLLKYLVLLSLHFVERLTCDSILPLTGQFDQLSLIGTMQNDLLFALKSSVVITPLFT